MTRWDEAWQLNSLVLADVASSIRVESEGGSGFADPGIAIPGRDGIRLDDLSPLAPMTLMLRLLLRYTDENGAVNHADGEAGHVYENFSLVQRELAGRGLHSLKRTRPHAGQVEALCKLIGDPTPGDIRIAYLFPLAVPSGSWRSVTESSATGNPPVVTTGGSRDIWDPIIILSAASTVTVTASDGTEYEIVGGAGPTYPVTVDVGEGTVTDDNGDDARGDVTFTRQEWCRLEANTAISIATTASTTVKWRNRWA
ncbi:MAG: hypothetical protein L0Z49_07205 [Actinobacteria bacterium]|nr:hypothetical protein [Actinomycetota bacterium]